MPYLSCKKIENDVYNFPTWQYCKYKDIFDSRIIINSTAKFYISISYQKDLLSIDTRIFTPSKAPVIATGAFLFRYSGKHIFLEFTQNRLLCFFKSQNMVMKFTFKRKKKTNDTFDGVKLERTPSVFMKIHS